MSGGHSRVTRARDVFARDEFPEWRQLVRLQTEATTMATVFEVTSR